MEKAKLYKATDPDGNPIALLYALAAVITVILFNPARSAFTFQNVGTMDDVNSIVGGKIVETTAEDYEKILHDDWKFDVSASAIMPSNWEEDGDDEVKANNQAAAASTLPTSEPTTPPSSEPATLAPTEAATLAPTEAPTEKPTEAPTSAEGGKVAEKVAEATGSASAGAGAPKK